MFLGDAVQYLADDGALALGGGQRGVPVVVRIHLVVQRPGEAQHLGAQAAERRLGGRQHLVRGHLGPQRKPQLAPVLLRAQAPGAGGAPGQVLLEETVELFDSAEGGSGSRLVARLQFGRRLRGQRLADEPGVALVFLQRHLGVDGGGVGQVLPRLPEQLRQPLEPGDDVREALRLGRVFQHQRVEQGVAGQLHVEGGVVAVALDGVQLEQAQGDLVLDQVVVGSVLRAQRLAADLGLEAPPPALQRLALLLQPGGAQVVHLLVEPDLAPAPRFAVTVEADRGSGSGRQRQVFLQKALGQL